MRGGSGRHERKRPVSNRPVRRMKPRRTMGHVPNRAVGGLGEARRGRGRRMLAMRSMAAMRAMHALMALRAKMAGIAVSARRLETGGCDSTGSGQALWQAPGRFTRNEGAGNRWALRIARAASLLTGGGSTRSLRTGAAYHE